jgi:hypothetical protein
MSDGRWKREIAWCAAAFCSLIIASAGYADLPPAEAQTERLFANHDRYLGQLREGKRHGVGVYAFASGAVYRGSFRKGKFHGHGVYTYPDGDVFDGNWVDGMREGMGAFRKGSLTRYEGEWLRDRRHGWGSAHFESGSSYIGEWRNDCQEGHGIWTSRGGDTYNGDWHDGEFYGKGTYTYADGEMYSGEWVKGKKQGRGVQRFVNNTWIDALWENNVPQNCSLGEFKFIALLSGFHSFGSMPIYPIGLVSEFLKSTDNATKNYGAVIAQLQAAYERLASSEPLPQLAQNVLEKLRAGARQLLYFGSTHHAMGLEIIPAEEGEFYYFDIFNSGSGLHDFHPYHREKGKYQTKLRYQVPSAAVTAALLEKLLNSTNEFAEVEDAYSAIRSLPGAEKVRLMGQDIVWQSSQKSGNCTLEWIMAYLKNSLKEPVYTQMRRELFAAALKSAKENNRWPSSIDPTRHLINVDVRPVGIGPKLWLPLPAAKELMMIELERKIAKREAHYAPS